MSREDMERKLRLILNHLLSGPGALRKTSVMRVGTKLVRGTRSCPCMSCAKIKDSMAPIVGEA